MKKSPKIETGKKMLGNKFESFQNVSEDTSTIKIEFFLIRQIMVLPVLKHLYIKMYNCFSKQCVPGMQKILSGQKIGFI